MVHFNWFNFGFNILWGEVNSHPWLEDTDFNSTDWDSSNTSGFVDILKLVVGFWVAFQLVFLVDSILSRASMMRKPLYHGVLADLSYMLFLFHPKIGMDGIALSIITNFLQKSKTFFLIYLYLDLEKLTDFSSILLQQKIICLALRAKTRRTVLWFVFLLRYRLRINLEVKQL